MLISIRTEPVPAKLDDIGTKEEKTPYIGNYNIAKHSRTKEQARATPEATST